MFFNSLHFALFLPIVFILYWFVFNKSKNYQNYLLITASYYFYSCWDWRFLFLLIFSTLLDYFSAIQIEKSTNNNKRKMWLWLCISINLGFLGVFKYYDFFATSFAKLIQSFGVNANPFLLKLILPVGISFYTFHGLSYIIDIYYKRIKSEKNFVDYSLFVSYFPLLVAGPIERATHLLPQIKTERTFNYSQAKEGFSLILFGLFKKIVIADNCSFFVNNLFKNPQSHSFLELWLGIIFFAFQIYGDFSGYSDIARGVSKLFGIELLHNFKFPYFSKDIADFWRRWHISLSSWFRDYIYIPLGGSKGSKILQIRNVMIIFLISGFWHGANWTFIIWGLIHALLFLPLLLSEKNRLNVSNSEYKLNDLPKIISTFLIVCIAWVFFRADTLTEAFHYLKGMFNFNDFTVKFFLQNAKYILLTFISILSILFLVLFEWNLAKNKLEEVVISKKIAFLLIAMLLFMGVFRNPAMFIYFQF